MQVVKPAREMGLVKLGTIAIDGTQVNTNASRRKARSCGRMQQAEVELKAQIDALLARAKATDEAEVNEPNLDLPADQERAGVSPVPPAGSAPGASRREVRVHGAALAANGDSGGLTGGSRPDSARFSRARRQRYRLATAQRVRQLPLTTGLPCNTPTQRELILRMASAAQTPSSLPNPASRPSALTATCSSSKAEKASPK